MALKPLKITGRHPDQPKPNTQTDRVAASIWPRSYAGEGGALGGKQLDRHEDLSGPSLEQRHSAGYATNSATTPSQEAARVVHTEKHPPKQAPPPRSAFHPKGRPKTGRASGSRRS